MPVLPTELLEAILSEAETTPPATVVPENNGHATDYISPPIPQVLTEEVSLEELNQAISTPSEDVEPIAEVEEPGEIADPSVAVSIGIPGIAGLMGKLLKAADEGGPLKTTSPRRKNANAASDNDEGGVPEGGRLTPGGRARQPRRSTKAVDEDRLYDGTQLHANHHGYFVHRDYAAHFFRWGWVARRVRPGMRVLDVGSGQDLPLPRVLAAPTVYPNSRPSRVTCVDWNPIPRNFNPAWLTVNDQFDFCTEWKTLVGSTLPSGEYVEIEAEKYDIISCLEVIEHMDEGQGDQLLEGFKGCLKPGGVIVLSTPVFDGFAAANHIHEYGARELWDKFTAHGLMVVERYGTYANLQELKKVMPEEWWNGIVEPLKRWYANDILSCFLAPLYPDYARNNAWVVCKVDDWNAGLVKVEAPYEGNMMSDDYYPTGEGQVEIRKIETVTDIGGDTVEALTEEELTARALDMLQVHGEGEESEE